MQTINSIGSLSVMWLLCAKTDRIDVLSCSRSILLWSQVTRLHQRWIEPVEMFVTRPDNNVSVRPAEPATIVNCWPTVEWQNLPNLDEIRVLSNQTWNTAVFINCTYYFHKCQLCLQKLITLLNCHSISLLQPRFLDNNFASKLKFA